MTEADEAQREGSGVLFIRGVEKQEPERPEGYAWDLPVVRKLKRLEFRSPITFFVGENGSGKSTLLEAIALAWGFNPEGGSRNFSFTTKDTHSALWESLRLIRGGYPEDGYFLRAESFYNMASYVDELAKIPAPGDFMANYGGVSLHEQSHGESFMALALNRFRGKGLYLLDEPEAALSPSRQLAFLARLHELVEEGAQCLIATHSPILMAYPNAEILQFSVEGEIRPMAYENTEHYQITRNFLDCPERMMKELFRI